MTKKISVSGTLSGGKKNFNLFKIEKIENFCPTCGGRDIPAKPFGTIFLPKKAGVPEEIVIKVQREADHVDLE
jgi:hypothetical protein